MNQMLWEEEERVDLRSVWRDEAAELASVKDVGAGSRDGSHIVGFLAWWMEMLLNSRCSKGIPLFDSVLL